MFHFVAYDNMYFVGLLLINKMLEAKYDMHKNLCIYFIFQINSLFVKFQWQMLSMCKDLTHFFVILEKCWHIHMLLNMVTQVMLYIFIIILYWNVHCHSKVSVKVSIEAYNSLLVFDYWKAFIIFKINVLSRVFQPALIKRFTFY